MAKELSIFVDESGDRGGKARYYLLTLVFHDQADSIAEAVTGYEAKLAGADLPNIPFHSEPLMNGHKDHEFLGIEQRKMMFSYFSSFVRRLPISYITFVYRRSQFEDPARLMEDFVATQAHQMQGERMEGRPVKDDILQMQRDAFPARTGISDNDAESRENAGAKIREPAAVPSFEADDLPEGLMNVPQAADHLRISKTSARKLVERQAIPAVRTWRLRRVRDDEPGETLRAMGNDI